jgi:hypothetical protein
MEDHMNIKNSIVALEGVGEYGLLDLSVTESNLFRDTMNQIIVLKEDLYGSHKVLYKTILESEGNHDVILEGFGEFFGKIKEYILKFLRFLKSLFDRFVNQLSKLVSSQSGVLKRKKLLSKFSSKHEFDFIGYTYTFTPTVPITEVPSDLNNTINSPVDTGGDSTAAGIIEKLQVDAEKFETELDKIRAKVIGAGEKATSGITNDEWGDVLFGEFRNGETDSTTHTFDRLAAEYAFSHVETHKKTVRAVEENRKKVDASYKQLVTAIDTRIKGIKDNEFGSTISVTPDYGSDEGAKESKEKLITHVQIYEKERAQFLADACTVHGLAFAAKLEAIKDCYKQDLFNLYKAIDKLLADPEARLSAN